MKYFSNRASVLTCVIFQIEKRPLNIPVAANYDATPRISEDVETAK